MSLYAVEDETNEYVPPSQEQEYRDRREVTSIPDFEGQEVHFTRAKISSVALEIEDAVFRTDQIVTLVVEARVAGVQHLVNDKTGKMERIHNLKALDSIVVPTDYETLKSQITEMLD